MRIAGWFVAAALAFQAPPQTGSGVIQGRVIKAGGTEPIADAQVMLNRGNAPGGGGGGQRGAGGAGGPVVSATTDESGGFVFRNLAPGSYTVTAGHKKYSGPFINSPDPSAAVVLANGQTAEALITMTPTSVIRGRIRDASGQFASNVQVEALVIAYPNGLPSLMPAISKASDDRGEYRLYGLPPGDYYIGATPRPPSAIAALAGGDRSVKTFYPNEFDISRATKITIHGGEEISNIDISIQAPQLFKISGTVSTTVPVAAPPPTAQGAFAVIQQNQNATIQLVLNSRDITRPEGGNSGGTSVSVSAAAAGPFEIANVLPGSYDLVAVFNGNSAAPAFARTVIDVRNQDVGGLVMTIRAGMQVRGSVTVDGGAPKAGFVRMALTPADALRRVGVALPANIAADGSFNIEQGCPDGHFRLSVAPLAGDLYVEDIRQGASSIYDTGFEIRGQNPDPIQVIIKSGAGTFDGTVQASGRPVIGGTVALVPASRRQNEALYYMSRSDSTGAFIIRGIAPGDYKMFAWDVMPPGAHTNAAFLEKYEERAVAVTIAPGSKVSSKVTPIPR